MSTTIGVTLASLDVVQLRGYSETKYLHTSHLFDFLFLHHEYADDVLGWARVIGSC